MASDAHDALPSPASLAATTFIDFDTPSVAAFAVAAVGDDADSLSPNDKAIRLFLAVREQVRYDPYTVSYNPADYRASAALASGATFCIPKAILLTAAARSQGIPARLGFADVTNHLATKRLLALLRTTLFAFHGYSELWLDGRWVKVTPAFNASLCERFGAAPIEFDGHTDAVLQPCDREGRRFMEYLADRGSFDDFPFDEMARVFREVYPHLEEQYGKVSAPTVIGAGNFEAEATAERS